MSFYINKHNYHERESSLEVGVCGIFTCRAIKPGVGVVRELTFPNLITNLGMDAIGSGLQFARMHLGTGTTPPAFSDTGLTNFGVNVQNADPTSATGVAASSPYYGWTRLTWLSSVGGATGSWTEIGVSSQNTNGNLRSHALIVDSGGSPTTFTVLSDEQFQGTYEFRRYVPLTDNPASITLSGTPYDTVTRALRATSVSLGWAFDLMYQNHPDGFFKGASGGTDNNQTSLWTGSLASITSIYPGGTVISPSPGTATSSYTSGNFYRDTSTRWGASSGVGLIKTVSFWTQGGVFQVEYDTAINKLATQEFIHNQRVSWARL